MSPSVIVPPRFSLAALFSLVLSLALVSGCGSGSRSPVQETSFDATPAISLQLPATARAAGQALALDVTGNGAFSGYQWDFGDGTQAAGGARISHTWARPGRYLVTVTAIDANGETISDSKPIDVAIDGPPGPCANASVAGVSAPQPLAAPRVLGIVTYANESDCPTPVNLSFGGLTAGNLVTLVFSNGHATATAASGTAPDAPQNASAEDSAEDSAHDAMLEANRRDALSITRDTTRQVRAAAGVVPKTRPAPAVGAARNWLVPGDSNNGVANFNRDTTVAGACVLTNGRNAIFWRDALLTTQSYPDTRMAGLISTFCGPEGGFARLFKLEGEPWGAAANQTNRIKDGTYWQDINVVLVSKPKDTRWAGVFSSANTSVRAANTTSNKALVVFVSPGASDERLIGVLAHETTHLVQFYQSDVARNVKRQTWFAETTAMMAEDLLAPKLTGKLYAPSLLGRIGAYASSGGGGSLIDWGYLQGSSYAMGMTFGAFLNRRYGDALFRDFIAGCENAETSWDCVDRLIRTRNGVGVADEFSRMGTSVFAAMPASIAASGYGYPALSTGGYDLAAVNLPIYRPILLPREVPASIALSATAQTYSITTVQPGQSEFSAPNLVIPPRTVMTVVTTQGSAP